MLCLDCESYTSRKQRTASSTPRRISGTRREMKRLDSKDITRHIEGAKRNQTTELQGHHEAYQGREAKPKYRSGMRETSLWIV
jgi:hypothetical protein